MDEEADACPEEEVEEGAPRWQHQQLLLDDADGVIALLPFGCLPQKPTNSNS